jgi:tRNA(Ile)-lysidine synthase
VIASRLVPVAEARRHLGADAQREFLDADRLRLPLRVRPVRPGDRFRPLGAPGRMLVSDFLTNAKVPRAARASALVVEDAGGIVWLWPHRLAERVRLRGESRRAAALTLRRLQPSSSGRGASSSSAARSSSASTGLTK